MSSGGDGDAGDLLSHSGQIGIIVAVAVLGALVLLAFGSLAWLTLRRYQGSFKARAASLLRVGTQRSGHFLEAAAAPDIERLESSPSALQAPLMSEMVAVDGPASDNTSQSNLGMKRFISQMASILQLGTSGGESPPLVPPRPTPISNLFEELTTMGILGHGAFGRVYKASWKGTIVAVKTLTLPSLAGSPSASRRHRMIVTETAISGAAHHPNVVQMYTFALAPVGSTLRHATHHSLAGPGLDGSTTTAAFSQHSTKGLGSQGTLEKLDDAVEVWLVLEYCDLGTLRAALGNGMFHFRGADSRPVLHEYGSILAVAADVARAMAHLHAAGIVHADLKPSNVLLQSSGGDKAGGRRNIAKVSDFGLSLLMQKDTSHLSHFVQGTLTHMAPEVLLRGTASRAADVYAFGILLWELYAGEPAYSSIPRALLGHEVAVAGLRPTFPAECPSEYQLLAARCWETVPSLRPTFEYVLEELQRLQSKRESQLDLRLNGDSRGQHAIRLSSPMHAVPVMTLSLGQPRLSGSGSGDHESLKEWPLGEGQPLDICKNVSKTLSISSAEESVRPVEDEEEDECEEDEEWSEEGTEEGGPGTAGEAAGTEHVGSAERGNAV